MKIKKDKEWRTYYDSYKLRVEAKATGANIHKINGKLGIIINTIHLYDYDKNTEAQFKEFKEATERAMNEIAVLTGVHGQIDQMIRRT